MSASESGVPRTGASPVDTIVAPCTASGAGERAIVRLSGPDAHAIAADVVAIEQPPEPGRAGHGSLDLGAGAELPVVLLQWWAPRSLTGEDVTELHLVAWPVVVTELVHRCVRGGARPAARGEFTRRAVVAGRMGLEQALAVARLVGSATEEEARAAAAALTGELARVHDDLRDALLDTLALIEAHVDFEEEDTEAVSLASVLAGIDRAHGLAHRLADAAALAPASDGETDVVLLGPPNAGKSRLMLALCPGAETTVSPVPGTTRDALEARVTHAGRSYRLIDGPGVASADAAPSQLDALAMEAFLAGLPAAAVVLHVQDVTAAVDATGDARRRAASGERPAVEVRTKADLVPDAARETHGVLVSAVAGTGLPELWEAISAAAPAPRAPDLATAAEARAAAALLPHLSRARDDASADGLPLLALVLRDALGVLEAERELVTDLDEAVLDRIFAGFCIGK